MKDQDTTANKAAVAKMCAAANTGSHEVLAAVIDEVVEPDVVNDTPLPVEATGAEGLKQVWAMLFKAFPDIEVTIEQIIAEGDTVVARNTVRGTQQGPHMGVPPSARRLTWQEIFIFRFVDGRVAWIAGIVDIAGQMRQLGILPTFERAD